MDGGSILGIDIRAGHRWYVAQTASSRLADLRDIAGLLDALGLRSMIPTDYVRGRPDKRTRARAWVAIPAYREFLFVELDYTRGDWERVNAADGVERVMPAVGSHLPGPVPEWMMAKVREAQANRDQRFRSMLQDGVRRLRARAFKSGDEVTIPEGSKLRFRGAGLVQESYGDRVKVLLSTLGEEAISPVVVDLAASEVEPA